MTNKLKPAVGYIRMSTDRQEDSPARQRRDIEALAERMGFRILRWYEDHGLTGTLSMNRPEFQRLLSDAKTGRFSAVLLSEQSRMSREEVFDAMLHWRSLRDAGVRIITCQRGELDFANLGGVITAIVDQYGARDESLKLADRVVSGKRLAVSRGQKQGGAPYGFEREILDEKGRVVRRIGHDEPFSKPSSWTSRLVVSSDPNAVKAVRFMFKSVCEGLSLGSIARDLNRRGQRTMYGKRFSGATIRQMVTNPVYAGTLVLGRKRVGRFACVQEDGQVVCENAHDALVDQAVFDQAQRMMRQRHPATTSVTPGRYLLTGLLFLAECGQRLKGYTAAHKGRKLRRRYYSVPSHSYEEHPEKSNWPSFRADTIERGVLAKLREFITSERNKRAICREITRKTQKTQANVARLEAQLADVRSRIERATENLALANPEDIPGISKLLTKWRERESAIRKQLQQANGEQTASPEAIAIMERLDELTERLSEADREKLAFAIRQTVKRITLRRQRLTRGRHTILMWDGTIELRDDLGVANMIPLTDEDIPSPGRWRDVVRFVRERGDVVYVKDVANALGITQPTTSALLAQAVLSGKVRNLGHQKGWIAAE